MTAEYYVPGVLSAVRLEVSFGLQNLIGCCSFKREDFSLFNVRRMFELFIYFHNLFPNDLVLNYRVNVKLFFTFMSVDKKHKPPTAPAAAQTKCSN